MKDYRYLLIPILIIGIDQASKLLVYTHMQMGNSGEIHVIGEWFRLHYLLNPGMAFGLKWDNEYGKLTLTLFRLVAVVGIAYYLITLIRKGVHSGLIICMGLILGGAVGNVIDSTFYGVFLENAPAGSPTPWFHGQVIDMLFFPLFEGFFPDWLPFIGGRYFLFFSPVFNIADSSIFIGVVMILIFQKKFFPKEEDDKEKDVATANDISSTENNKIN